MLTWTYHQQPTTTCDHSTGSTSELLGYPGPLHALVSAAIFG